MLKTHHIGYAAKNLEETLKMFLELGYKLESGPVEDHKRNVEIAFVTNNGYCIELISPLNDLSPIRNYLDKIGNTPYHICYETDNIEEGIKKLRNQRYLVVEKPSDAIALDNQRVAFLYHPNYGLIELLETSS